MKWCYTQWRGGRSFSPWSELVYTITHRHTTPRGLSLLWFQGLLVWRHEPWQLGFVGIMNNVLPVPALVPGILYMYMIINCDSVALFCILKWFSKMCIAFRFTCKENLRGSWSVLWIYSHGQHSRRILVSQKPYFSLSHSPSTVSEVLSLPGWSSAFNLWWYPMSSSPE